MIRLENQIEESSTGVYIWAIVMEEGKVQGIYNKQLQFK